MRVDRVTGVQVFVSFSVSLIVVLGRVVLECKGEFSSDGVEWIVGLHWYLIHHVVVTVVELSWVHLSWRRD